MAAFRLKLTGLPGAPWGRVFTVPDAAMNRVIAAAKLRYGQVPTDPQKPDGVKRDMIDEEAVSAMFNDFVLSWLDRAFIHARDIAAATATRDSVTNIAMDNA